MTKEDVLRTAEAEIGYLEKASEKDLDRKTANAGSANFTKYARDMDAIKGWYNTKKNGYDWCAVFVEWCFVKAYGEALARRILPHSLYSAGCTQSLSTYKAKGRFYAIPQPGDQIFFTNSRGLIGHTGIVVAFDGRTVTTVEGNTSSEAGVVANGGCVRRKSYPLTYNRIAGYGRPDWSALHEEDDEMLSYEDFCAYMDRWVRDQEKKPEPDWSKDEGAFEAAQRRGIVNGSAPCRYATRVEVISMLDRALRAVDDTE